MIFDKKKQGFRLVPIQSHYRFDKKIQGNSRFVGSGNLGPSRSHPSLDMQTDQNDENEKGSASKSKAEEE